MAAMKDRVEEPDGIDGNVVLGINLKQELQSVSFEQSELLASRADQVSVYTQTIGNKLHACIGAASVRIWTSVTGFDSDDDAESVAQAALQMLKARHTVAF